MVKTPPVSATKVVEAVLGKVLLNKFEGGDAALSHFNVTQVGEPLEVDAGGLAFVISESYVKDAEATKATMLVVQDAFAERVLAKLSSSVKLVVGAPDAYVGLAHFTKVVADADPLADWRATPSSNSKVDSTAKIAAGAVICEGASVGARTTVLANAVVGPGVSIGSDCVIFPGTVIYPQTSIGNRVRIHANTVIGSDGFGYARGPRGSVKIWHLGRVIIGDDVEIGAGTMIDRGTMKDTIIEQGAKIDNLVQIGHNGHVKAHAILCAQVGMAGNVTIGRGVILAGKVGIADKIEVGDGALIGPMSGLSKDVKAGEQMMGNHPAKGRREWWRMMALVEKLPELFDRIKKLEGKKS